MPGGSADADWPSAPADRPEARVVMWVLMAWGARKAKVRSTAETERPLKFGAAFSRF
jgi:hypothetical protein